MQKILIQYFDIPPPANSKQISWCIEISLEIFMISIKIPVPVGPQNKIGYSD